MMTGPTMKDLGIEQLTPDQRIDLALEIWESLGAARPGAMLTPEQESELMRRDAELDSHPERAWTWQQIRKSIEGGQ